MASAASRRFPATLGVAGLALLLGGCLTLPPRSRTPGSGATTLEGVPVREFGVDRCGAGSLSAVLNYFGDPISMEELDATLPKASNNGVLSIDMLLAARRRGFQARLVEGSPELLTETLVAERPAILMLRLLNAPGLDGDYFHYVIADGVDPGRGLYRLQFGDGRRRWASLDGLERAWKGTDHALLLVESPEVRSAEAPDRPGASRTAPSALAYGMALEDAGRSDEAAAVYRDVLDREAETARAWTNLGNAEGAQGRTAEAEAAYRRALALDPAHRDALNNLAWLLLEEGGRLEEAEELAVRAVAAGGPDPHLALDTLARVQVARGRCAEAAETARRAVDQTPADSAARAEMETVAREAEAGCAAGGAG